MAASVDATRVASQKAVIYCRVSTKEQSLEGYSLDHQRQACEEYCASKGFEVSGVYLDVISGGKANRPGLDSALQAASRACLIVVWSLDRLGRNLSHLAHIRDSGLEVHIASKGGSLTTTEWGIFATLAQDERETIAKRTRAGMRQKAKNEPGWNPGGIRHRKLDKARNVDLAAAASARSRKEAARMGSIDPAGVIRVLALDDGLGLSAIARKLDAMGIKTPKGGKWSAMQVKRVMALHGIGQESVGADTRKEQS